MGSFAFPFHRRTALDQIILVTVEADSPIQSTRDSRTTLDVFPSKFTHHTNHPTTNKGLMIAPEHLRLIITNSLPKLNEFPRKADAEDNFGQHDEQETGL
jgi:hypothetical protein